MRTESIAEEVYRLHDRGVVPIPEEWPDWPDEGSKGSWKSFIGAFKKVPIFSYIPRVVQGASRAAVGLAQGIAAGGAAIVGKTGTAERLITKGIANAGTGLIEFIPIFGHKLVQEDFYDDFLFNNTF